MKHLHAKKKLYIIALSLSAAILVVFCIAKNMDFFKRAYRQAFGYNVNGKYTQDKIAEAIRKQEAERGTDSTDENDSPNTASRVEVENTKKQIKMTTSLTEFVIKNYYLTDTLPEGITPEKVDYYSDELDSNKNLLKQFKYLVVDTTIQNVSGEDDLEYLVNCFYGRFIDENYNALLQNIEFRYFSRQGEASDNSVEAFHFIFKKDEKIEAKLIFILDMRKFDNYDFYFVVNNSGRWTPDENYRIAKAELTPTELGG